MAGSASPMACPKVANKGSLNEGLFSTSPQAKLRKIPSGPHDLKLPKREPGAARSATNSRCHSAVFTTRICISTATRTPGGRTCRSHRYLLLKQLCPCSRTSANASGNLSSTFAVCTWPARKLEPLNLLCVGGIRIAGPPLLL